MKIIRIVLVLLSASIVVGAARSDAAEPEPIRFEVEGDCIDEATLRQDIGELGGSFRDANLDDHARVFRIEATRGAVEASGRLVVRDLVFRESVRETSGPDCRKVEMALALFVATALDERPPAVSLEPAAVTPPPAPWPEPASDHDAGRTPRARVGSGGLAASAFVAVGGMESKGVRVQGVARVVGTTRLGIAGAVTHEETPVSRIRSVGMWKGSSARLGGVVGWGAPWNDGVVGFAIEAGLIGTEFEAASYSFSTPTPVPPTRRQVAPYSAVQLVLQVPLKSPIRPIASLGFLGVPKLTDAMAWGATTGEVGVVWQAW